MEKIKELTAYLCIPDNRGSNNPHLVGMTPVEGAMTITVEHISLYYFPRMG